jgi:AcrR family transcriptional regulator
MGRPKQFDREEALRRAIPVFWENGFADTSAEDLTRAMGIGRQSLYDTFGDKRSLYLEALGRYNADSIAALLDTLHAAALPLDAIEGALLAIADQSADAAARGCMGVNAICEFGMSDPDVARLSATSAARLETALESVLRDAQHSGDLDATVTPRAAARFLAATLAGMKVQAKAGATRDILHDVASLAVRSLRTR